MTIYLNLKINKQMKYLNQIMRIKFLFQIKMNLSLMKINKLSIIQIKIITFHQ
jgi:hypothetical protein